MPDADTAAAIESLWVGLYPELTNISRARLRRSGPHTLLETTDLVKLEPRLSEVVEMQYLGGFTEVEIAAALGVTARTVLRDWLKASALLR